MTKQTPEQRREFGLVYTPNKGLNGLIEDTQKRYKLLGIDMPLQMSFLTQDIEVYTGVTYWQDVSGGNITVPITHSLIFGIERIGLLVRNNNELANRLFERSKELFKNFPSLEEDSKENMHFGKYKEKDTVGKWRTYNGYSVFSTNDGRGNFELELGDRCSIKEKVPQQVITDLDTLISDCVGEIAFDRIRTQHPSVEDGRYYVRHPSWIYGG